MTYATAMTMSWRVRFQEHWLYVYLLLEFHRPWIVSWRCGFSATPVCCIRILIRSQSLYQDRLPPVLPIVLYNGDARWKAAVDLSELIHPTPRELQTYQPQQRYLLLDEGAHQESSHPGCAIWSRRSFAENSRSAENVPVVTALLDWLQGPQQTSLRRAFSVWIQRVILANHSDIPENR